MKFGGTSVGSAARMKAAADLIATWAARRPVTAVVSAMSKITDLLLDTTRLAEQYDEAAVETNLATLTTRHLEAAKELVPASELDRVNASIADLVAEFRRIVSGMRMLGYRPARAVDEAIAVGERLSALIVSEHLRSRGLLSEAVNAAEAIVTDAVFSMDGDIAPLPALLALAEEFDAWLIVDDAHGFGVLGRKGRGALEHFDLRSERLIVMGTLGKAAGLAGAFVVAHDTVTEYLLQAARNYIFSTAGNANGWEGSMRINGLAIGLKMGSSGIWSMPSDANTYLAHVDWRNIDYGGVSQACSATSSMGNLTVDGYIGWGANMSAIGNTNGVTGNWNVEFSQKPFVATTGTTLTPDLQNGNVQTWVVNGTGATINAPQWGGASNLVDNSLLTLKIKQDATGSRTVTSVNAAFKISSTLSTLLSTGSATANAAVTIPLRYDKARALWLVDGAEPTAWN
jgi:hypothetical protein